MEHGINVEEFDRRRRQVCDWLNSIGIDCNRVPLHTPLRVLKQGDSYLVHYSYSQQDEKGQHVFEDGECKTVDQRVTTSIAPPGYSDWYSVNSYLGQG